MPIIYQKWITRADLRNQPASRFVFGDNAARIGLGGQAKEMRDEPNAIGIATKLRPSMDEGSFFFDCDDHMKIVQADLYRVTLALDEEREVVVPSDGLGTGLSQLPARAPRIYGMLWEYFDGLSSCPWLPLPGYHQ